MKSLYVSHGKSEATVNKARLRFHWPHMKVDITNLLAMCTPCAIHGKSHEFEPPMVNEGRLASLKHMDEVSVNYGIHGGKNYLIMVDRASGYVFCKKIKQQTTADTIKVLDGWFYAHGKPRTLCADDGPSFRKGFCEYLEKMGI